MTERKKERNSKNIRERERKTEKNRKKEKRERKRQKQKERNIDGIKETNKQTARTFGNIHRKK